VAESVPSWASCFRFRLYELMENLAFTSGIRRQVRGLLLREEPCGDTHFASPLLPPRLPLLHLLYIHRSLPRLPASQSLMRHAWLVGHRRQLTSASEALLEMCLIKNPSRPVESKRGAWMTRGNGSRRRKNVKVADACLCNTMVSSYGALRLLGRKRITKGMHDR